MGSEGRIFEVVFGMEFSDYDRRTGDSKTRPTNWCRQFARPRKVTVYDTLDRPANARERTASIVKLRELELTRNDKRKIFIITENGHNA